ncbi:aspartyl protease family protein [Haloferula chungangensis]|uniref:Aspartyl protease family protein n=1 Tax=Haloferula chungangensis TaxID=1048331 RepID=A0ABW2L1E4_9BACT
MILKRPQTLLLALGFALTASADDVSQEYREFTGSNGKVIQAVLVDKDEDNAMLLLSNGGRAKVPLENLSEADRDFVKAWSKEKALFLQKCLGLTVRELLELRGYEPIPFRFESNSIIVDGKLNGKDARFLIDTGAGTSLLHVPFAEEAGCEIGPMDEIIYGVSGQAPAGWTTMKTFQLGQSVFKDRKILATDRTYRMPDGYKPKDDAIFGADFLNTLDAVITYKDRTMFLRPDLSDESDIDLDLDDATEGEDSLKFRIFKTKDGKVLRGNVVSKSTVSAKLKLTNGQEQSVAFSRFVPEDEAYVRKWSEAGDTFLRYCGGLSIEELLTLRKYQSFEYERKGNHIFVDGTLNGNDVTYMIDTGADSSLLHLWAAEKYDCEVGPMDQKVHGIGGEAPAAVTKILELTMGKAKFTNRKVLSTDLARFEGDDELDYDGIFGADFMRELDAVITYKDSRIFLIQR